MTNGEKAPKRRAIAALARLTSTGKPDAPAHARASEVTFGAVRRLDSGTSPARHPSIRWPDERRPHARPVDNASTPTADGLRTRLHEAPPPAAVDAALPVALEDEGVPAPAIEDDAAAPWSDWVPVQSAPPSRGRRDRCAPRRDGVEANARLTGSTAAVLLVLLAVEGFTLVKIHPLLNVHVFVGMLLVPPVLLKVGSTMWRFAKFYMGDPEYRRKGPPVTVLRLLGPIVVVLTVVVLMSGVALLLVSENWRNSLLLLHKVSFILWFAAMTVHVLGHILDTAKLAPRDWYWRTRRQVAGASARQWLLVSAVVVGVIAGILTLPHLGSWVTGGSHLVGGSRR